MTTVPGRTSFFFKFMCVLTLVGNLLLILANALKAGMLGVGIQQGSVGAGAGDVLMWMVGLVLLSCLGAMVGASLMLTGRRLGYKIYAVSIGLHLLLAFCAILLWAATIYLMSISVLLVFYSIIPVIFFLYFTKQRDYLS
ncbi:MAG: hypothetical protein WAT74_11120 [Flavobacteriales bacterium]